MPLTITRRKGQRVYIGADICVQVALVENGKVRLSISAPATVRIDREELLAPDDPRRMPPPSGA